MTNRDNRRLFYVVQFIELPFEGIDDYVCVPHSWLLKQKPSDRKVHVTYPKNEDPYTTRDRVKKRERPNDDWRLYIALIKYESEEYKDAEYWIATRNDYGPGEEKSEMEDTQPKPVLNKKLRSAGHFFWSDLNPDKPQLSVKPYKNPRKPLPRISIKRPVSKGPDKNFDNKRLKLNANVKPGIDTDHVIIDSDHSKQERSVIITDNQLIQNDQKKTSFPSDSEMNTEQSTQPGVIKENQSVVTSAQPSSKQLLAEQQHSPKLTVEQELSPVGLSDQQPLSISAVDLDKSDDDIKCCENVLAKSVAEKRTSTKTPPKTLEQTPQSEPINEKSTLLVRDDHSLSESYQRDVSVRQSNEPNDSQKTLLNCILTAPTIIPRPLSTANPPFEQCVHPQLPIMPVSSTLYSKPKRQGMDESNSIKVVHNHRKPRSQGFMIGNKPLTYDHESNCKNMSQSFTNSAKKQSPVVKNLKNPVDKKTRLEGITKNITTTKYPLNSMMQFSSPTGSSVRQAAPLAQNYLHQAPVNSSLVNNVRSSMGEECVDQRSLLSEGIMNTSAAQNLSKLAHQYSSFVEASREQQYSMTQEDYLQQFARMQDMLRTPNMVQTIYPRAYHQNAMMNEGFVMQSQPNPTNPPIQYLPPNDNQTIPVNSAYVQEIIRHELMRRSIDGAHTTYKTNVKNGGDIQLTAYNSSNQSYHNFEHPQQGQDPPNYQDPRTASTHNGFPLQSKHSSHIPRLQRVTKRPRSPTVKIPNQALSNAQESCFLQELGMQQRVNQNSTEKSNTNQAALPDNITVELVPTTKDFGVQTMPPSDQRHETQSTVAQSNHVDRHPRPQKTMVDQATETDSILDVDHYGDDITRSPVSEITPNAVGSACPIDKWMRTEQGLLYQETASDSEDATEREIESENEIGSEANQPTLTSVQNLTPENQQIQSRIDVEQDMLSIFGTLFTQMGANLSYTCDMFNYLRNSMVVCAQTYEQLLEKVDKFNSIQTLQIPTSPPNNVPSQAPLMTQERPEVDDDNNTGVGTALTPIREQRGTFSLPPEYDPNDSKWTLKYREYKPGLVELLPRTGVYVSKKELKRCIQESTDCRTLARLLLTEVFSKNALSVCSLTGGRAKAFNSVKIDVRPGLDEHARMVLLAFVEEHGNKHGWITSDAPAVISTIRTKINEIRAKHGQAFEG